MRRIRKKRITWADLKKRIIPRPKRGKEYRTFNFIDILFWAIVVIVFGALFLPFLIGWGFGASTVTGVMATLIWAIYSKYRKERKERESLTEKNQTLESKVRGLEEREKILSKTIAHQEGIATTQRERINDMKEIEDKLRTRLEEITGKLTEC